MNRLRLCRLMCGKAGPYCLENFLGFGSDASELYEIEASPLGEIVEARRKRLAFPSGSRAADRTP